MMEEDVITPPELQRCIVCYIRNNNVYDATLFEFPDNVETRKLWLNACGFNVNMEISPDFRICSKHFERDCFQQVPNPNLEHHNIRLVLKPNAVPTKFNRMSAHSHISGNYGPSCSRVSSSSSRVSGPSRSSSGPSGNSVSDEVSSSNIPSNNDIEKIITIKNVIESSRVPIVFHNMLNDWEPFKWGIDDWKTKLYRHPIHCRKGKITCTKEPLWEHLCTNEDSTFIELDKTSETIETHGNWLYFDYKYIGEKIDADIFNSVSWDELGYDMSAEESTLWIGGTGAHTPCHQDLYGINLVAQVFGKKRWILMPPEMEKYLEPTRIPYEESSCYSKINFSCPENIKKIDKNCKYVSVILSPGDVLFVPHKWWHYVENLTTAVSINAWIQVPKLDNVARLKESVVRFMAGSVCSVTLDTLHKQLLNPNEPYSRFMTLESSLLIDRCIKEVIENEKDTTDEPKILDPALLPKILPNLKYEALIPDQHLYRGEFDTVYHRIHHSLTPLSSMSNTDISFKLLDAFCSENVVNEIVKNLLKKD